MTIIHIHELLLYRGEIQAYEKNDQHIFTKLGSVLNCWDNDMFENKCSHDVDGMRYFKNKIILI